MAFTSVIRTSPVKPSWRPMSCIGVSPNRQTSFEHRVLERQSKTHMERCQSAPDKTRRSQSRSPAFKPLKQTRKTGWQDKQAAETTANEKRMPVVNEYDTFFDDDYDFDKWSDDEKTADDLSSDFNKKAYEAACRDLRITPVDSFSRQMACSAADINLKNKLLTSKEVKAIAVALVNNISAQRLDLSGNDIGSHGCTYISQVLTENSFLTEIDMSSTNPGLSGLKALAAVVKNSTSIKTLNLSGNGFDIGHAPLLAEIISTNDYLQTLDISYNKLGADGGQIIGPAIGDNVSLRELSLKWNHLRMRGAIAVARGLEVNSGLERVDLSWNGFGLEGCEAMATTLARNQTIVELSLECNRIDITSLETLMEGVIKNESLQVLKLGLNPMTTDGAMYLLTELKEIQNGGITQLDISDVPVDKHFLDLLADIQRDRKLSVRHGMVFRVNDIRQAPETNDFKHYDPLMILYQYMREDNLRLVDVFHSFDVNKDSSISRQEFREGFLAVNIPITEHALDVLLKKLDLNADGKVDFTELGEGHKSIKRKMSSLMHKLREAKLMNVQEETETLADVPYAKLQGLVKEAVTTKRTVKLSPRRPLIATGSNTDRRKSTTLPSLTEIPETNKSGQENRPEVSDYIEEESDQGLLELANSLQQLFKSHRSGNTLRLVFKATSAFNQNLPG